MSDSRGARSGLTTVVENRGELFQEGEGEGRLSTAQNVMSNRVGACYMLKAWVTTGRVRRALAPGAARPSDHFDETLTAGGTRENLRPRDGVVPLHAAVYTDSADVAVEPCKKR